MRGAEEASSGMGHDAHEQRSDESNKADGPFI
jgi:hypothetical protein